MSNNGRPTIYSEELATKFLDLIAEGESVVRVCTREDMPAKSTIFKWLVEIEGFSDKYNHAKALSGDSDADKVQNLSEKAESGDVDPNAARVAMTGYMWSAARKQPKKYGDRLDLGNADDKPLVVELVKSYD